MTFGKRLRQARKQKNQSQEAAAEELRIAPNLISLYECGRRFPPSQFVPVLADYSRVSVADIFYTIADERVQANLSQFNWVKVEAGKFLMGSPNLSDRTYQIVLLSSRSG